MKGYLIDPDKQEITEVDYNGDWRTIAPMIHCETFTVVNMDKDSIYVDDEGLINNNPHGWFFLAGYHQPLKGFGLLLGLNRNTGESIAAQISLGKLRELITFPPLGQDFEVDTKPKMYTLDEKGRATRVL